jgi:hypothetical protein
MRHFNWGQERGTNHKSSFYQHDSSFVNPILSIFWYTLSYCLLTYDIRDRISPSEMNSEDEKINGKNILR